MSRKQKIIDNNGIFESGYFVLRNDSESTSWSKDNNLLVTTHSDQQIKEWLLNTINAVKKYIKICSFILTDKEVFKTIKKLIKEHNIVVFILTQIDPSKINTDFLTNQESAPRSERIHLGIIGELFSMGGHIRAAENIHAKFLIVDGKVALLTSANITKPSLTLNNESGIIVRDKNDVKVMEYLFDTIYKNGTKYKRFTKAIAGKRFVKIEKPLIEGSMFQGIKVKNIRFTYKSEVKSIYDEIIDIIQSATQFIFLSSYSIVKLGAIPELLVALKEAINNRNVMVKIFCRGMSYRYDHLLGVQRLSELGCEIYGDLYNHSKGILNETKGMIFTANIDGNHGLISGFEIGSMLTSSQYVAFLNFHEWQLKNAIYKYQGKPSKQDVYKTYDFYVKEKKMKLYKLPGKIKIKLPHRELFDEIGSHPLYLIVEDKTLIGISINGTDYSCTNDKGVLIVKKEVYYKRKERYMFKYKEIVIEL